MKKHPLFVFEILYHKCAKVTAQRLAARTPVKIFFSFMCLILSVNSRVFVVKRMSKTIKCLIMRINLNT